MECKIEDIQDNLDDNLNIEQVEELLTEKDFNSVLFNFLNQTDEIE